MMEAVRTSEASVDNHFTRQYNPEDNSEHIDVIWCLHVDICTFCHEVHISFRNFFQFFFLA
jgi:hypothetical protein